MVSTPRGNRFALGCAMVIAIVAGLLPLRAATDRFGPKSYAVAAKHTLTTSDSFAVSGPCDGVSAVYTLVVRNGNADGTQRIKKGSVTLNGTEVVSDNELKSSVAIVTKSVTPAADNTLAVNLEGDNTAGAVTITLTRTIDLVSSIFAEKSYPLSTSKSGTFRETFTVANPSGTFTLVLKNGTVQTRPMDDVRIVLNGTEIITKKDIDSRGNQDERQTIVKPVTLQASNTLQIDLKTNKTPAVASLQILRHAPDTEAPAITVSAPADGASVTSPVTVTGTVTDLGGVAGLTINGAAVTAGANGAFTASVPLAAGATQIAVVATDCEGNARTKTIAVVQGVNAPPQIAILSPAPGSFSKSATVAVSGSASDASGIAGVTVNAVAATVTGNSWTAGVTFPAVNGTADGARTIAATATGRTGQTATTSTPIVVDTTPPSIAGAVDPLPNAAGWNRANTVVSFTCADSLSGIASCTAPVSITSEGAAQTAGGKAVDRAGNETPVTIAVKLDKTPPDLTLSTSAPADPLYNVPSLTLDGTATDGLSGIATVTCNGAAATRTGSSFRCTMALTTGANNVAVVATDGAGNAAMITRTYTVVRDVDPPAIRASAVPSPNASGWAKGAVQVAFDCTDTGSGIERCPGVIGLHDGANQTVSGTATDRAGNSASASLTVSVDGTLPMLSLETPVALTKDPTIIVRGTATDAASGLGTVQCNGEVATMSGSAFTCSVALVEGASTILVKASDQAGNETMQVLRVSRDVTPPAIVLSSPSGTSVTADSSVAVHGFVDDDSGVAAVQVNGAAVTVIGKEFETVVALHDGDNAILVQADDVAGNQASQQVIVTRRTEPTVAIRSPADLAVIVPASVDVAGTIGGGATSVTVNGIAALVSGNSFTVAGVPLSQGRTVITAAATDASGKIAASTIHVYHDTIPPRVVVRYPADNSTIRQSPINVAGMIDDIVVGTINPAQVRVRVNGIEAAVANRAFLARDVPLAPGLNSLLVTATDQGGNVTTIACRVTLAPGAGITSVSGDGQTATIGATLPQPLVVRAIDPAGAPVSGQSVRFRVLENNGTISTGATAAREVTVITDASGQAAVRWTLGTRAGAGNQRVEARGASDTAVQFMATATPGAASLLVVDSGNSQFGATGQQLARPLVAVAVDGGSNRLANVPVAFRVIAGGGSVGGTSTITVNTDSDGRAWVTPRLGPIAGNDNNTFEAGLASGSAVTFVASGRVAGPPAQTRITGVIVDNSNIPIPGVTVRIDGTPLTAQSDAQGIFTLASAPVGYVKLFVDGSTAQREVAWPMLEYAMYTIAGIDNHLEMPVFLLPLDIRRGITVDEQRGGTLTLPELPGFSLTVLPGSATFPGGTRAGTVSVTLVHADKMPMSPGFGQQPRFLVTIQPPGAHFDPPAQITFPNVDGLAPGEITEMYSFDHDLGQFVAIGTGSISEDGSVLVSDPGVGIIKGGWHCGGNPATSGTASCLSVSGSPGGGFGPGSGGSGSGNASADLAASAFAPVGSTIDVTASGTPPAGGSYSWQIVDDPADIADDPSVATFTSTPACAGQPTCVGKLKGLKPGTVSVQIVFTSAAGGTVQSVTSPIRKILFVGVTLQWLLFENNHEGMTRDEFGMPPYLMPATQWARNPPSMATPLEQYPVWYLHSTPGGAGAPAPRKIRMAVKLNFNPVLPAGLTNAKLAGSSSDFSFKLNNVVVPAGQPYIIREVEADVPLPEATRVYRPLTIDWTFQANGGALIPLGKTANRVYVTLDPISPTLVVPQTVVDLAVGTGGAETLQQAADATWRLFSPSGNGPGDVKTWDGRELIYYAQAAPTMGEPDTAHADAVLLMNYQSGQCRTFVDLIALAWAVNGVDHVRTKVTARDGRQMLIGRWQFPFQLFPDYMAFFYDNNVPHQPGTYGDLVSLSGIPGQNSPTPGRKLFDNHVILRSKINGLLSSAYFDPSYGQTYSSENDFEAKAVDGYAYHSALLTLTARPRTTLGNIQFGPEP